MGTIIMNTQLAKLKKIAIFFVGIFIASIPAMAYADWSIMGLGTLGGNESSASDINDSGQVVGSSHIAGDIFYHAFITGPNGVGMTDLGTFGGILSSAHGINDSGEAVGIALTADIRWHSFIFSHGEMTDLSVLPTVVEDGWTDLNAAQINNNGQIVGSGYHHGNPEAFLLPYIPAVPEPETYLMLLSG